MLVIDKNVSLEELKKYNIYPEYECNTSTGETRIAALTTPIYRWERLRFKKITKKIAEITIINHREPYEYALELNKDINNLIDLDTLYKLIKAGIVRQVK